MGGESGDKDFVFFKKILILVNQINETLFSYRDVFKKVAMTDLLTVRIFFDPPPIF